MVEKVRYKFVKKDYLFCFVFIYCSIVFIFIIVFIVGWGEGFYVIEFIGYIIGYFLFAFRRWSLMIKIFF